MAKSIQCPRCNGSGVEYEDKYDNNGNWIGQYEETCSYCNGTGQVDYDEDYYNKKANKYRV